MSCKRWCAAKVNTKPLKYKQIYTNIGVVLIFPSLFQTLVEEPQTITNEKSLKEKTAYFAFKLQHQDFISASCPDWCWRCCHKPVGSALYEVTLYDTVKGLFA